MLALFFMAHSVHVSARKFKMQKNTDKKKNVDRQTEPR